METNLPPTLPTERSSGILGELRQLMAGVSFHLLTLLKLAQIEAEETKKRIFWKIFFLLIALLFFVGAFLTANTAAAFYLYELLEQWQLALLALAGGNLILGALFVIIASCLPIPFFKDTITELETDLLWITEKYRTRK